MTIGGGGARGRRERRRRCGRTVVQPESAEDKVSGGGEATEVVGVSMTSKVEDTPSEEEAEGDRDDEESEAEAEGTEVDRADEEAERRPGRAENKAREAGVMTVGTHGVVVATG